MSSTRQWLKLKLPVDRIKPHPQNYEYFSPPSDAEIEELAGDLSRNGQKTPIEVVAVPDGTEQQYVLVKGERRLLAAKQLEWGHIDALVRGDTTDPNDLVVIRDLINDNLIRQQLDDLALARCYRGLKETTKKDPALGLASRDQLANRISSGKSGRQMERLEALLDLPRDVQDMISDKSLSKADGAKILKQDSATQQRVYAKLREGILPKHVLRTCGVIESVNQHHPEQIARKLIDRIGNDITTLRRRMADADGLFVRCEDYADLLESYTDFFAEWRDHVNEVVG